MIDDEQQEAELPLENAGSQLARARQAAGKSLADIAQMTKISERQLAAIEAGNYAALPSRAYAVGFTRTYAKAVGLDSAAVIELVRAELAQHEPDLTRRTVPAFEPGDPARLPGRRVAWYAAAGLVVVLLAGFLVWPSLYAPGGSLPSILPTATPSVAAPSAAPAPAPAPPTRHRDRAPNGYRRCLPWPDARSPPRPAAGHPTPRRQTPHRRRRSSAGRWDWWWRAYRISWLSPSLRPARRRARARPAAA